LPLSLFAVILSCCRIGNFLRFSQTGKRRRRRRSKKPKWKEETEKAQIGRGKAKNQA
jgi:hypothetical protein